MAALLTAVAVSYAPPTATERVLVEQALFECPHARPERVDAWGLLEVLRQEELAGVPHEVRGLTLATACRESGYRADAGGDGGRAVGMFQLWPWAEHRWGVSRWDAVASARFFLASVLRNLRPVRRRCARSLHRSSGRQCSVTGSPVWQRWRAAEVHAVRAPRKGGRCRETSKHFRLLERWRDG